MRKGRKSNSGFPMELRRGSVRATIYRQEKGGNEYFRLTWYEGSVRRERVLSDAAKAKATAETILRGLAKGDHEATNFTGKERLIFQRAQAAVAPFGVEVDTACTEWANSKRELGQEHSLSGAVAFYLRHHGPALTQKTVAEAVAEFRTEKELAGLSDSYLQDIDYRLGALAKAFACNVASVSPELLRKFVDGRGLSPRGVNNFRTILGSFFAFCRKRRYLARDSDPLAFVDKRKLKASPVEIFSPQECAALLGAASPEFRVCLAVQMFAGCRAEEVLKLEWSDLERAAGFIEIGAAKAKTASRRLVPIESNLARWLAFAPRRGTKVWPHSKPFFFEAQRNTADAAGVEWKKNAPRHSFISYRLALVQDAARVALEAGNSPQMIFRHYREIVTPSRAKAWFAIAPDAPENVTAMPAAEVGAAATG